MGLTEQSGQAKKSGVTEQWTADPSWPQEQRRLFDRLKDRFAAHLVPSDTQRAQAFSPHEEQKILDQIDSGRWDRAMSLDVPISDGIALDRPSVARAPSARALSGPERP